MGRCSEPCEPANCMSMWYAAAGTACTTTMKMVPNLSHNFQRVRVLRAIMMPSGRPSASAMASEISPSCKEMGIFSPTISVMATPLRKTFDSPRSPWSSCLM